MWRKIQVVLAIVGVTASCLLLQALANEQATEGEVRQRSARAELAQADFEQPDTDYLDFYGIGEFETSLPVVYIDTSFGSAITKNNPVWTRVFVGNEDGEQGYPVMSAPQQEEAATIKYRGASSYSSFDKKQYRLKFYTRQGSDNAKDVGFLGLAPHSEWVLNGPYLDKSLMRNRLMYGLAREAMDWAPATRYCELFLNGEYQGVYLLVEPVTNGEGRLGLTEYSLVSGQTAFVVKRDRVETEENPLAVYGKTHGLTNNDLTVDYPSSPDLTPAQTDYITWKVSAFEEALYSDDFGDEALGYLPYIDLDNFATYVVLNEFAMIRDTGNLSTYCYSDIIGPLKMAVWDFNNGFNHYQGYNEGIDEIQIVEGHGAWFYRLLQDRRFVGAVIAKYRELRKTTLSDEHLLGLLDTYDAELGEAAERNFAVWGFSLDLNLLVAAPDGTQRDIHSYDEAKEQLRTTMLARLAYLDEHIDDLYQNCVN